MGIVLNEIATGRQTYADYCRLPEGAPYQLIGGELIMTPAPSTYHEIIRNNIHRVVDKVIFENGLGKLFTAPVDVFLSETEVYQPDLLFVAQNRFSIIEEERINGAPDWVAEILSPSTAYYDLRTKYRAYAQHGVKEYWIVDPKEKSVQVYVLEAGKFRLDQEAVDSKGEVRSRVIPGFNMSAEDVFRF